jgi:radical SAM superfamily enzyme
VGEAFDETKKTKSNIEAAMLMGLKVLAHVMAGLPGETPENWDETVRFVNALPVAGIKFHNLFVADNTPLANDYRAGLVQPPTLEDYAAWVGRSLKTLRPDMVVHRLAADPAQGELVAPQWAGDKRAVHNAIMAEIRRGGIRQGMAWRGQD